MEPKPKFSAGRNIAIKVPPHQYESTIRFYRDVLGFDVMAEQKGSIGFAFGACRLWIDRVTGMSQAETWLEVTTHDVNAAEAYMRKMGVVRCDGIEPLPQDLQAFWIASPASIIHLVCSDTEKS